MVRHWFKHHGERFFRARGDMRFAFIAKHRHIWPASWRCDVLSVSCLGFHAWLNRPLSDRAIFDAKLVMAIDTRFKASDRAYGARRVWHDVLEEGLICGLHRIQTVCRRLKHRLRFAARYDRCVKIFFPAIAKTVIVRL